MYVQVHEGSATSGHWSGFHFEPASGQLTFYDSLADEDERRANGRKHRGHLQQVLGRTDVHVKLAEAQVRFF